MPECCSGFDVEAHGYQATRGCACEPDEHSSILMWNFLELVFWSFYPCLPLLPIMNDGSHTFTMLMRNPRECLW